MASIEHAAQWTAELDRSRAFYEPAFGSEARPRYHNPAKRFTSVFLRFASGARLELMHYPGVARAVFEGPEPLGYAHLAFSVGSEAEVDALTARFRTEGVAVVGEPRRTGDGYYESVVRDPDGNRVGITVQRPLRSRRDRSCPIRANSALCSGSSSRAQRSTTSNASG